MVPLPPDIRSWYRPAILPPIRSKEMLTFALNPEVEEIGVRSLFLSKP